MELAGTKVSEEEIDFAAQAKMVQAAIVQAGGRSFVHDTLPDLDRDLLAAVLATCPIIIARKAVAQRLMANPPDGFSIAPLLGDSEA